MKRCDCIALNNKSIDRNAFNRQAVYPIYEVQQELMNSLWYTYRLPNIEANRVLL